MSSAKWCTRNCSIFVKEKKQKEKNRQRKAFFENPFRFTSELLGKPRSGKLRCGQEEVEESVEAAHGDPDRQVPLGDCPFQILIPDPSSPFNMSELKFDEVSAVVKRAIAGSAPGPSGTTYRIYKNCPKLLRRLSKLL